MATIDKHDQHRNDALRHYVAEAAAVLIAELDPHSREDLACYLRALTEAIERRDQEEIEYIRDAIVEVFSAEPVGGGIDISQWQRESDAQSERATQGRSDEFMTRYHDLKERAGLKTQREVADACGLSVNTINAIETQRVRPQWRTLEKLARGLGANVRDLIGDELEAA